LIGLDNLKLTTSRIYYKIRALGEKTMSENHLALRAQYEAELKVKTVSAQNFKNFCGWLGHELTVEVPV
jgi:hypothetical protein